MIAHMIHQIEYMLSWNDSLPDDAELTFVISALDQCKIPDIRTMMLILIARSVVSSQSRYRKDSSTLRFCETNAEQSLF